MKYFLYYHITAVVVITHYEIFSIDHIVCILLLLEVSVIPENRTRNEHVYIVTWCNDVPRNIWLNARCDAIIRSYVTLLLRVWKIKFYPLYWLATDTPYIAWRNHKIHHNFEPKIDLWCNRNRRLNCESKIDHEMNMLCVPCCDAMTFHVMYDVWSRNGVNEHLMSIT